MRALLTAAAGLFAGLAALGFAGTAAADDNRHDRHRDRDYYDDDRGRDYDRRGDHRRNYDRDRRKDYDRRRDRDHYRHRDRDRYRDYDHRRYRGGYYDDRRYRGYRPPYCRYDHDHRRHHRDYYDYYPRDRYYNY